MHNLADQNEEKQTTKVEKSKPGSSKPATKRTKAAEKLEESKAEEDRSSKKNPPAGRKTKAKKTDRKEVETERAMSSASSKKRKKAEGQAEETETKEPEVSTRKKKNQKSVPERHPASIEFTKKIKKYYKLFKDRERTAATEEIKNEMKSNLQCGKDLTECRLNIYWHVPSCGVTSKSKKKDLAHFAFNDIEDCTYMSSLALALKCAELFVTWVRNMGLYHVYSFKILSWTAYKAKM